MHYIIRLKQLYTKEKLKYDIKKFQIGLSLEKEEEWGWTTNFAFAVKPSASNDPEQSNTNGEWVNARFTGADGAVYEEWYQIANDKLIWWSSAKRETGFPPPPPVE